MLMMKIHSVDNGFCKVNYKTKNAVGETIYYCLMDSGVNHGGVQCYRTCRMFEPSYVVTCNHELFEVPTGDTQVEIAVRKYLTEDPPELTGA